MKTKKTENKSHVVQVFRHKIDKARVQILDLRSRLGEDPYEALSWLNESIAAAADLRVFESVIESLEKFALPVDQVLLAAQTEVRRLSLHGAHRSTGAVDQQLHAEVLRAWSQVADLLPRIIERGEKL